MPQQQEHAVQATDRRVASLQQAERVMSHDTEWARTPTHVDGKTSIPLGLPARGKRTLASKYECSQLWSLTKTSRRADRMHPSGPAHEVAVTASTTGV